MTKRYFAGLALAALAVTGCSGSDNDREAEANFTELEVLNEAVPLPAPLPAPIEVNNTVEAAPEPLVFDEAQVQDDADASGMTARLPTEDSAPANEAAVAE